MTFYQFAVMEAQERTLRMRQDEDVDQAEARKPFLTGAKTVTSYRS